MVTTTRRIPVCAILLAGVPGARATAQESASVPTTFEFIYTGDVFANLAGGAERGIVYLDNADVTLAVDLGRLVGWRGGSLFVYGLGNHGGQPSALVGDAQGVNNIEAVDAWRLYELWVQHVAFGNRVSVLAGLYDLNSEFDVVGSAQTLLNSSFGVGAEFAASREFGPSIFPVTSLAARLRVLLSESIYFQVVGLDGVPGDPGDPRSTHVAFEPNDGVLFATELGCLCGRIGGDPLGLEQSRRSRVGRHGARFYRGKIALGTWWYTAEFDRLDGGRRSGNGGIYLLGEWQPVVEVRDPDQGLWVFVRAGLAEPSVNRFAGYSGGGFTWRGPFSGRNADELSFGIASVHNGNVYLARERAAGLTRSRSETTLEVTYFAAVSEHASFQLDAQYVMTPDTDPSAGDALALVLRTQLSF